MCYTPYETPPTTNISGFPGECQWRKLREDQLVVFDELAAKGLDLVVGRVIEGLVANDLLGQVVVVMLGQMGLEVGACQTGTDQQQLRGGLQLRNHLMEEVVVVLGPFVAGMGVVIGLMAIDVVLGGPAIGVKLKQEIGRAHV